jgi:hypothetical protein
MWSKRLTEGERIEQLRIKTIYLNYLLNKSDPSFRRESGSGSSGQESRVLDLRVGAVYGPCPVPTTVTTALVTPTLVTTDLLIHFEANDLTSYSGSGLTWVNIGTGGTDYNATLSGDSEAGNYPVFIDDTIKSFQFTASFLGAGYSYLYNNYMYFPRPDAISDDFTWCAWINTTDVGYDYNHYNLMFIVSTETGGVNNDFGFGLDSDGNLAYGDGSLGGTDITIRSTQPVNTGTWMFVAVTREKATGSVVLYINGVADTSGTCNVGNTLSTAENVLIGSETDFPGYTFGGYIGAILGNTSVLTAEQIMQNFTAQRATYGV